MASVLGVQPPQITMCWCFFSVSVSFLCLGRALHTVTVLTAHPICYLTCIPLSQSLSLQSGCRDAMADHAVGMAKVKVAHILCSCHALCRDTIFVSRSQLGASAWFTCGVSLLVVQDHILIFHGTWNDFRETCSIIILDSAVEITDL